MILAAELNRAIGSKCSPEDMFDLSTFALHFGSENLRNLLQRSAEFATEDEDSANSSEEDQTSAERSWTLSRSTMSRRLLWISVEGSKESLKNDEHLSSLGKKGLE